jgi:hypothetical protein
MGLVKRMALQIAAHPNVVKIQVRNVIQRISIGRPARLPARQVSTMIMTKIVGSAMKWMVQVEVSWASAFLLANLIVRMDHLLLQLQLLRRGISVEVPFHTPKKVQQRKLI